ncbi:hypothetical protein [Streptomyces sp. NPDC054975]
MPEQVPADRACHLLPAFTVTRGRIAGIRIVVDPAKLASIPLRAPV